MLLRLFDDTSAVEDSTMKNSHTYRDEVEASAMDRVLDAPSPVAEPMEV